SPLTRSPTLGHVRVIRVLDAVGHALILQLCFVVASLLVVTAWPAAVALQREWNAYLDGRQTGVLAYARAFRDALRTDWPLGLLVPAVFAAYGFSLLCWRSAGDWVGVTATAVLVGLGLAGLTFYLALLAVA